MRGAVFRGPDAFVRIEELRLDPPRRGAQEKLAHVPLGARVRDRSRELRHAAGSTERWTVGKGSAGRETALYRLPAEDCRVVRKVVDPRHGSRAVARVFEAV